MDVIEQILVLLSLTSGLFDTIPLDRIREAELEIGTYLPETILQRLSSADGLLSDPEHAIILDLARKPLVPFFETPPLVS